MAEEEALPDHLRCCRTDGRKWRCRRRVKDNMKLCEIHYLQGRHRQYKEKVPEFLKLQRTSKKAIDKNNDDPVISNVEIRVPEKRRRSSEVSEAMGEALRKKKQLKRRDMQLELMRMVLKREVEKRRKKKKKKVKNVEENEEQYCGEDLMRKLPNGLMAISPAPAPPDSGNAGSVCRFKLGFDHKPVTSRRFRSKNIERLTIGKLQIVPSRRSMGSLKKSKKKCHLCHKSGAGNLLKCSSCQKEFFCRDCIKEKYFDTENEARMACPVCRGTCTCKDCLLSQTKESESKETLAGRCRVDRILRFHYLICVLLPLLKQIQEDQIAELEMEAKLRGKKPSEISVKDAEFRCNEQHCCNNCKAPILDLHRSCPSCCYNLCLSCFWDFCSGSNNEEVISSVSKLHRRRKACVACENNCLEKKLGGKAKHNFSGTYLATTFVDWKSSKSVVGISCPPKELGGCGDSLLCLRCLFPSSWIREMEASAEEIVCSYDFPEFLDKTSCCSQCFGRDIKNGDFEQLQQAAARENSNDNYLFYPVLSEIHRDSFEHFQKHWVKGHPVIVRNVLRTTPNLSWDPLVMFCTYLERCIVKYENNKDLLEACLDWCEVEINVRQYFVGSLRGQMLKNSCHEMLKLKGWLSSQLFREEFPAHFAELIRALPIQEYMNPLSGILNLAANLSPEILKPEFGPCVYLSYGCVDELVQADSVTKLCYDSYDLVNILVHTTDDPISSGEFHKIRKLLKNHRTRCQRESSEITNDQIKENEENGTSALHTEDIRQSGLHKMGGEKFHCCKGLLRMPCYLGDASEAHIQSPIHSNNAHDRECNLDSDCDSEHCLFLSGTAPTIGAVFHQNDGDLIESSDHEGKIILTSFQGAQWDVFRREDVPKLTEYLKRHCDEFSHMNGYYKQMVHPILDRRFFLDTTHKMRLKEEFEIEPWTFKQCVGEAVIIPAGCPYQIQNPKGCVHVVLNFISPENVTESSRLIDEIHLLPENHKAKGDMLEVRKLALYSMDAAIKEIHKLTCKT